MKKNMNIEFGTAFLIFAWIRFIAKKDIGASILLILAGTYEIIDVISVIREDRKVKQN